MRRSRPLQYLTDTQLETAITDRARASEMAPNEIARQLTNIALDRLNRERDKRLEALNG